MQTLRAKIEGKIQNRHLLAHTFYTRWQAGKLTQEELQGYAKEYYAFEKEFPRFLSTMHSKCVDQEMRQTLLENLKDEEEGTDNHPELWLRFAEGMGVTRKEVTNHFHSDETEHLLRTFRKYSKAENQIEGLAALYAYERQQPDVARTKMEGLHCFYGVTNEDTVAFFKAHQKYDVIHSENEAQLMDRLCQTSEDEDRALKVTDEVLNALYDFLDGVERRYKPTLH